jgi:hypothetical protein
MNPAYKHLDSKLRIAEFTLGQWAVVMLGVSIAIVWGFYLSPLGMYLTFGTAVYLGAIPVGFVVLSSFYEIDVGVLVRSSIRWRRLDGRFLAGPGPEPTGYVVTGHSVGTGSAVAPSTLDIASLWES